MDHSNATKSGGTGAALQGPAEGGQQRRRKRGWQTGVDTQIRIHFQPGLWNSFVPATGLRPPPAFP